MSITPTELLRSMDIFEELPVTEVERIASLLAERRLSEGELLFKQGDPGDAMYIVTGGRIRLFTVDQAGVEKLLTHFGDGAFFGEMALLTGGVRSASAQAVAESKLLVLRKDAFDELVATNRVIVREMLKVVARRAAATHDKLAADEAAAGAVGAGKVWVFFGARGGSGKTTLAVNLAMALAAEHEDRVALVDLDLTFGHVPLLLNLLPKSSLAALPSEELRQLDRESLNQYLQTHSSGLRVFIGASRPEEGEAVTADHVKAALEVMRRQFVHIVVDAASNLSEPVVAALEAADKILLVCTPDLAAVRDIRELQRVFADLLHIPRNKVAYVMNQFQPFRVLTREQFEQALEIQLLAELPHAGDAASKSALNGEPLYKVAFGSPFVKALEAVAAGLQDGAGSESGQKASAKSAKRGLFKSKGKQERAPRRSVAPAASRAASPSGTYPATLTAEYPSSSSRLLALVRGILVVPVLVFAGILVSIAWLVTVPAWLAILVRGRFPAGLHRFVANAVRVQTNVNAYLSFLTDAYPPFSGSPESPKVASYPVRCVVEYPGKSSRLRLFLRMFLMIPHLVVGMVYALLYVVIVPIVWLLALVLGKIPVGLYTLMLGLNRYMFRLSAWLLLLVDPFPPLGLKA